MRGLRWWNSGFLVFLAAAVLLPDHAHAQAWVDEPGSLGVGLDYTFSPSNDIVETDGMSFKDLPIVAHGITLSAEYTPIENLAISAQLPLLMVKYDGPNSMSFPPHGRYDDGDLHTTLTDFRAGVRYSVLQEPYLVVTPHVAFSIPVADYETVGFATAGRHLKQLHVGASVARTFSPSLPMAYFHASFEFTFAERYDKTRVTEVFGQNRSDSSLLLGYFFLDGKLNVSVGGNLRLAHRNGVDFTALPMLPPDAFTYHDPLLREQFLLLGAGVGYALTDTISASVQARIYTWGTNTRDANVFGLGLTWGIL